MKSMKTNDEWSMAITILIMRDKSANPKNDRPSPVSVRDSKRNRLQYWYNVVILLPKNRTAQNNQNLMNINMEWKLETIVLRNNSSWWNVNNASFDFHIFFFALAYVFLTVNRSRIILVLSDTYLDKREIFRRTNFFLRQIYTHTARH